MDYQKLYTILPKSCIKWTVSDLQKFLDFIGLSNLYPQFKQLSIDGSCLNTLTEEDLRQELQIKSTITIKKIMKWIKQGLMEYDLFLNSRNQSMMNIDQIQNIASLTQKPNIKNISSMQQPPYPYPNELAKSNSFKSIPEQMYNTNNNMSVNVNNAISLKNNLQYIPAAIRQNSQKMQIQQSSMISEPQQDKKRQLQLIIQQSDGPQTSFFSVKQQGAKIGRHSSNQILILDQSISRFHAEIKFHQNMFFLRDTGSTTGTFIKINGKALIFNNMIIQMGSNQFQARYQDQILVLQIIQGPSVGYTMQIPDNKKVTAGRKQTNLLNFPQDQHLSNTHATITPFQGKYYIEDMGTTNGTWMRLSYQSQNSEPFQLLDKTVFKIGSSQTYVCTIKTTFVSQKPSLNACVICCQNDKDCVYMPCKHNAACIRCSKNLKQCPICRLKIQDFIRIYKN